MMAEFAVSMPKLISTITLRVRFARVAGFRLWLGIRVMKLAAMIAGCGVEIVTSDDESVQTMRAQEAL